MNIIKRLFKNIFKSKKPVNNDETDMEFKKIKEGIGINKLVFTFNHLNTYLPYEPVLKEPEFFRIIKKCFGRDNVKFNFDRIVDEFDNPLHIVGNNFEIYMNNVNKIYYKRRTESDDPFPLEKIICFNLFNEYIFYFYPVYTNNDIDFVHESRISHIYYDNLTGLSHIYYNNFISYDFPKFRKKPLLLHSEIIKIYKINSFNVLKI